MDEEGVLASPHQNGSSPSTLIFSKHTESDCVMEGEVGRASNEKRWTFKRICVFCGSKAGSKSIFSDATVELGKQLVERNIDLVYGGGSNGLMGLVSKTVFDGGRHVLGIIPKALMPYEISGSTIGELKIVSSMHERKSEMAKRADAFIALPGGYGTLEELLEMITWNKLGIHDKPVGLLNVDGYFNGLIELLNKGVEEDFIDDSARHIIVLADTAEELMNKMEEYAPVHDGIASKQSWEVAYAPVHDGIASKQTPVHDGIASKQSWEEDYAPVHGVIASKQTPVHDGIASKQTPVHDGIASKQSWEEDYAPVHGGIASKQTPVHDGIASKQTPVHDEIASKQSWEEDYAPVHDGIASKQTPVHDGIASKQSWEEDYAPVHDGIASKQSSEED